VPHQSEPDFLVLHALRVKGFAELDASHQAALAAAEGAGLVKHRTGRVSGWTLTAAGRDEHARLVKDDLERSAQRDVIADAYRRFLELNAGVLESCTEWQLNPGLPVLAQLGQLHNAVLPICDDLAVALDRFAGYGSRLDHAINKVRGGDGDWFTKPLMDSYHTVWFELHEDLLSTLGIERKEGT
jgi:hypothetical protein